VYDVSESVWLYNAQQIRHKKLNLKQDQGNMIRLGPTDPHIEMARFWQGKEDSWSTEGCLRLEGA